MKRKQIARETTAILAKGEYLSPGGNPVSIAAELRECMENSKYYEPEALQKIHRQILSSEAEFSEPEFEVVNETTLSGATRLMDASLFSRTGVLNFASARNPGGGFLGGADAQEESLARSSGLYYSLLEHRDFYDYHRANKSGLYSDRMIYSPKCPVFRDENGMLLEKPYQVDFITSPAPNASSLRINQPEDLDRLEDTFRKRCACVLSLAAFHKIDALVLGAWGCGAFFNSPTMVAAIFHEQLSSRVRFRNRFRKVLFSVLDKTEKQDNFSAFHERFSGGSQFIT